MKHMSTHISEERIISDLLKALESSTPELQAIAAEGLAKLMLTKLLKNGQVMYSLVSNVDGGVGWTLIQSPAFI